MLPNTALSELERLRISEARFRAISNASPLGIYVSDIDGKCIYSNTAYEKITGLALAQTIGQQWGEAIHPDDRQHVLDIWQASAKTKAKFHVEARFLRPDASIVWARINAAVIEDGSLSHGYVQTVEDITERKSNEFVLRLAEDALFNEKERAQVTLNSIGDGVITTDLLGRVTFLNPVAEQMTGWSQKDALGLPFPEVFHIIDGTTRLPSANPANQAIHGDKTIGLATDCLLIRRDGFEAAVEDSASPIHNRDGRVTGSVIVFHDVTQAREMKEKMSHLAQHDFLTSLPNRALLTDRLKQAIGLAQRQKKQLALLFMDLDHFKSINDSLGHAIGDQLLQQVAERLKQCVRTTDTVCRQGGDEFVILLTNIDTADDAIQVSKKLISSVAMPYEIEKKTLNVTLSIGISIYPDDGESEECMINNADIAMYHAKEVGRNNYQFFHAGMTSTLGRAG